MSKTACLYELNQILLFSYLHKCINVSVNKLIQEHGSRVTRFQLLEFISTV